MTKKERLEREGSVCAEKKEGEINEGGIYISHMFQQDRYLKNGRQSIDEQDVPSTPGEG